MEWLLLLAPLSMLGLLCAAIAGAGPMHFDPMSPDEELEMFMRDGMTREEAIALQDELQDWANRAR